jgi:hypothetical protein
VPDVGRQLACSRGPEANHFSKPCLTSSHRTPGACPAYPQALADVRSLKANPLVKAAVDAMMEQAAIAPAAIAEAIGFALDQPESVDVNELIARPTAQA